ncbi:hypothetical protein BU15DRAFT_64249 [Melanogaster broomeanus]|nr:hypothetical protein BU15DRAFT_64249 [Melanogaster broomeanus]
MCHSSRPGHLSRLCPLHTAEEPANPTCVDTPTLYVPLHINEDIPDRSETPECLSTPDSLRVTEDPPAAVAATDEDSFIGSPPRPSPRPTEENPDPDILIDSRPLAAEQIPLDLNVTTSDEPSTSSPLAVDEVSNEERLLQEWSDVYPIEILSPTPTRFVPVMPSPLLSETLERYIFSTTVNVKGFEMLSRFMSGAYHLWIQTGYGAEFGSDAMVAQGLAQLWVI